MNLWREIDNLVIAVTNRCEVSNQNSIEWFILVHSIDILWKDGERMIYVCFFSFDIYFLKRCLHDAKHETEHRKCYYVLFSFFKVKVVFVVSFLLFFPELLSAIKEQKFEVILADDIGKKRKEMKNNWLKVRRTWSKNLKEKKLNIKKEGRENKTKENLLLKKM